MDDRLSTKDANARLWGARASDWAKFQEVQHRPAYNAIIDRFVFSGTLLLDVGCGSGMALQIASNKGAVVYGFDAATDMLSIARERVPNGELAMGDLEELHYPDAKFDVVTGFNAFQYAGNPVKALAEARRVTKPDGHVVIMTWGPPNKMPAAALVRALGPLLPPSPPGAPGPFALSDEIALRGLASQAGLTPLDIVDVDSPFQYVDLDEALLGLGSSGVAVRASDHSGQKAVDHAHRSALAPFRQADGRYHIDALFRCLIAKP